VNNIVGDDKIMDRNQFFEVPEKEFEGIPDFEVSQNKHRRDY
jgi:hypothetical protein